MISLIVGFPGSGKSYYAVKRIHDILSNDKKNDNNIENIYTNIGGIKFDYFPNSKVGFKKLKEDELMIYLSECFRLYELYKSHENVDDYLIKYSKEQGFYNALIIFDECHDFFSGQDRIKIFWLTYHRHLNHEIILLTQNKSLINTKYRAIPEQFIEAQPRSKKIFSNTLSYKHYVAFAMRKQDLFSSSSIKTSQEIFNLYQSGNKSNQKSVIIKFIVILIIGLLIALGLFIGLLNSFKTEEIEEPTKKENRDLNQNNITANPNNQNSQNPNIHRYSNNEDYVIKILFDSKEGYFIHNEYYSILHFNKFLRATKSKILSKKNLISNEKYKLSQIYIKTNKQSLKEFFILPQEKKLSEQTDIKLNF